MTDLQEKISAQWQDAANLVLGIWLAISPWVLGYALQGPLAWNAHLVGVAIAVMAAAALWDFQKWEEGINAALAVWLIASPWIIPALGGLPAAAWNQVVVGLAALVLALWSAATDRDTGTFAAKS